MKCLGSTVLLSLVLASGAAAQSFWYVDVAAPPGGDGSWQNPYDSIQFALDQPTTLSGDSIRVARGTYNEQIDLLGKEVHIGATSGPMMTIIDGGGLGSTLNIVSGEGPFTRIEGFTITGGVGQPGLGLTHVGGGLFLYQSSVTLRHCIFTDNQALMGGGIFSLGGNLNILTSTFADNRATIGPPGSPEDGDGGAIWAADSQILIRNSFFNDNIAGGIPLNTEAQGGAIFVSDSSLMLLGSGFDSNVATCNLSGGFALGGAVCAVDQSIVKVASTQFHNSIALADMARGGALYLDTGQLDLEFGWFTQNVAGDFLQVLQGEGGAIYVTDPSIASVETSWFVENQAQSMGGAVYGVGYYRDCEFIENQSRNGGAAYASWTADFGAMTFDEVRFLGNETSWGEFGQRDGGAVHGPAFVMKSGLYDNIAHGKGGGAYGAYLFDCTLQGNATYSMVFPAEIRGGGAHDCWLYDCVIFENTAIGSRSMGVFSYGGGVSSSFLQGCELYDNTADFGGGGVNSSLDRVTINANHALITGGGMYFTFMPLVPHFVTNSIIWNNGPNEIHDAGGVPTVTWTDVLGGWPGLGNASSDPYWYDEANHDYQLLAGSPCIDAGDPTVFDPDGTVVDMGAHPYDPTYVP